MKKTIKTPSSESSFWDSVAETQFHLYPDDLVHCTPTPGTVNNDSDHEARSPSARESNRSSEETQVVSEQLFKEEAGDSEFDEFDDVDFPELSDSELLKLEMTPPSVVKMEPDDEFQFTTVSSTSPLMKTGTVNVQARARSTGPVAEQSKTPRRHS